MPTFRWAPPGALARATTHTTHSQRTAASLADPGVSCTVPPTMDPYYSCGTSPDHVARQKSRAQGSPHDHLAHRKDGTATWAGGCWLNQGATKHATRQTKSRLCFSVCVGNVLLQVFHSCRRVVAAQPWDVRTLSRVSSPRRRT